MTTTTFLYDHKRARANALDLVTREIADAVAMIDSGRKLIGKLDIEMRVHDERDVGWAIPVDWLIEEIDDLLAY